MNAPDPTPGKFGTTLQLFRLVGKMPKDQQLIILEQVEQRD